jgi:predicted polyphosphate/ATP-dependent NAD kinase
MNLANSVWLKFLTFPKKEGIDHVEKENRKARRAGWQRETLQKSNEVYGDNSHLSQC